MAQFEAFAPGVEVNGQTVLSVVEGMGTMRTMALQILARNGIPDPKPGQWYSQQAWLDAFKAIAESVSPATLFQIGKDPGKRKVAARNRLDQKSIGFN